MINTLGEVMKEDGTLSLSNKNLQDFSMLPKMCQDFSALKSLDLSNNNLHSVDSLHQVSNMLDQNQTIETLVLRNCKINTKGLNTLCNNLASLQNPNLLHLDIRDNPIPDPQFKMLFSLLQNNSSLIDIEYTLNDHENMEKL
jgi:Ran GTPase-activating protein (RanGAP) involved in mRNA processing and transport